MNLKIIEIELHTNVAALKTNAAGTLSFILAWNLCCFVVCDLFLGFHLMSHGNVQRAESFRSGTHEERGSGQKRQVKQVKLLKVNNFTENEP